MADSDLIAAIRNALARNQSIESAMQSLLNAGYSQQEVQEAARESRLEMQQGSIPIMQTPVNQPASIPAKQNIFSKKRLIVVSIIALGILLVGVIAYLVISMM